MTTVRKAELAEMVAMKLNGPRTLGDNALNAVLDSITASLAQGDRVVITGFGTFETRDVKERQVRAIRGRQAGQLVTVPAHQRIAFSPGSELSAVVGR